LLEVKFAEVDRPTALTQLASICFPPERENTIGSTKRPVRRDQERTINDTTGANDGLFESDDDSDALQFVFLIFFFNQIHLGGVSRRFRSKNLLQILSRAQSVAVNGKEASFLAEENSLPVDEQRGEFHRHDASFARICVRLKSTPVFSRTAVSICMWFLK